MSGSLENIVGYQRSVPLKDLLQPLKNPLKRQWKLAALTILAGWGKFVLPMGVPLITGHLIDNILLQPADATTRMDLLQLGGLSAVFLVAALIAVLGMAIGNISANLMTLGGIAVAIGMLCDGAIVMVENIHRHLADSALSGRSKISVIANAAKEVARPIVFSLSIVIIVFLPVFTLRDVEGKMFLPMASTVIFAILGAIVIAIVVSPVLSLLFLKQKSITEGTFFTRFQERYKAILSFALHHKRSVVTATLIAFVLSMVLLFRIGTEFIPTLEEGTLVVGVNLAPSSSLEKNVQTIMQAERMLMEFDEIVETVSKTGRLGLHENSGARKW